MKITIDQKKCIGCGSCQAVDPEHFEIDENNMAVFKGDEVKEDDISKVKEAADICPVDAIEIK